MSTSSGTRALLSDVLRPGLKVVFCGTALGTKSAQRRAYYAGPGNSFWRTLHEVGLTPRQLVPSEYRALLENGIGLTDLCKTRSGSDDDVGTEGFDVPRLIAEIEANSPPWIAFNGKNAARGALGRAVDYGIQKERLGGARAFVLPSTSGAARRYWDPGKWRELADLLTARASRPA
ncbi:MAG: mismatch-specific DNA-glycosylase [Solirubrobacterales bacterium]